MFLYIAAHGGFHVCHTLLDYGLFLHVDPRGTEGVTEAGAVAGASLVKNVLWAALGSVFCRGIGSLGCLIEILNLYDFERAEGIVKALDGLGKAAKGDGVIGFTIIQLLL